jgi:SAM-dependent methyltransferase
MFVLLDAVCRCLHHTRIARIPQGLPRSHPRVPVVPELDEAVPRVEGGSRDAHKPLGATRRRPTYIEDMQNSLDYYARTADAYVAKTKDLDMEPVRRAFKDLLPAGAHILDAGCGSGRDTLAFMRDGFQVTAFDGCAELARHACELTGLDVQHLRYDQLDRVSAFDGVWACSSLVHLDDVQLDVAFSRLFRALRPGGMLFTCFKLGTEQRLASDGRFFNDFTPAKLATVPTMASVELVHNWVTGHLAEVDTRWLNVLLRKPVA